ncbi:MAG: hypothetical protein R3F60_07740 [bacterium]
MRLAALALLVAGLAGPARAGRNPAQDHPEAVYDGDPDARRKLAIEAAMGIYQVLPPMRHPSEAVDLRGGQVRLNIWHPVGRQSDQELVSRAVKWLIFGRTRYARGVRGIFSDMPDVSEVLLVFHEVIRPDEKGRRASKKPDEIKPYLAIKLDRRRFERMTLEPFAECVDRGDCDSLFKSGFAAAKFDRRYVHSRRQEDEE